MKGGYISTPFRAAPTFFVFLGEANYLELEQDKTGGIIDGSSTYGPVIRKKKLSNF